MEDAITHSTMSVIKLSELFWNDLLTIEPSAALFIAALCVFGDHQKAA
jgi:hypothetical protein